MFSKFSVKKPYTVMVGVILVLILGFVSFTNMTADLFPDINMPYAMVMTTVPGASPEEVEMTVSKPIEQAMATVNNVENVQSVSSENMSMVMMEFSQTTNMDSASLEMRESLDQVKSFLDDRAGNPMIIKMNPEMMPVMVAAAELKGSDSVGITDLVEKEILPELESLEGVASVTASGEVKESVQVVLRKDKIDQVNEQVSQALGLSFQDGKEEMAKGKEEMADAENELNQMKEQLDQGKDALSSQMADAQAQLENKQDELLRTEMDLDQKLAEIESGTQVLNTMEEELREQEEKLVQAENAVKDLPGKIEELNTAKQTAEKRLGVIDHVLKSGLPGTYEAKTKELLQEKEMLRQMETDAGVTPEVLALQKEKVAALEQEVKELEAQIKEAAQKAAENIQGGQVNSDLPGYSETILSGEKAALEANIQVIEGSIAQMENALQQGMDQEAIAQARESLEEGKAKLQEQRQQMEAGKAQILQAKEQIASGKITLDQAMAQLNQQQIAGIIDMSSAHTQLAMGQSKLEEGKAQLKEGEEQLEKMEDQAADQADMDGKITPELVSQILMAQNFRMPAGYVMEDGIEYLIRVGDKFADTQDMEELVLFDLGIEGLEPITLSMVADVAVSDNSSQVYANINGNPGVLFTIQKQTGYSTGDVSDRLREEFDELSRQNEGLRMIPLMDQGVYIHMVVDSVINNLLSGALLAILILFIFLKDIRPTAIVACSIPVSVLGAVVLMYFSGITLNIISLSGLALGVGMLVDNSIVVIENIYRLRNLGVPLKKAAIQGASQVAAAITSSTLTTVCVFLPIVFTEGITRQLFVDMGLTIGYSLLASLVIALSMVPAMASGALKKQKKIRQPLLDKMTQAYGRIMEYFLRRKAIVLLGAAALLILSGVLIGKRGSSFIPSMESTQTSINIELPKGSSIQQTGAMADEIMERLENLEDIEEIGAMAGAESMMGKADPNTASIYLILSEKKEMSDRELAEEIYKRTEDLDCELVVNSSQMDMSALGGSGIQIRIMGKELDVLSKISSDLKGILEKTEGLENVSDGMEDFSEELRMIVNKEKASAYQLTTAQVFQQVQAKIKEQGSATSLSTDEKDYPVEISDEEQKEYTREDIKNFVLEGSDKEGNKVQVPLKDIADFEMAKSADAVKRLNQSRFMMVSGEVKDGYNIGLLGRQVSEEIEKYDLPAGYSIKMAGEDETIQESMIQVMKMLLLAVVFIYLIMVAQFQSLLSPFIVMFTVPLAFTGGFLGLLITGEDMSVIAMIGFVMLSGIIVNNGIVLVDYTNQLRREGKEKREAIIEAGKTRMRPILMTALTTILGLSTMSMGVGMGADMVQSMAVVTTGGLLYGTLLTLFVVPCIYDIMNRKKIKKTEDEEEEVFPS